MTESALELDASERPQSGPVNRWVWPAMGLLAIVLFELTANVALSAFVLCLKAGWSDFAAARWIARNDRQRGRRRALCHFQAALGAFKIVLAGAALSVLLVFVLANLKVRGRGALPVEAIAITALTALSGFFLSSMLTLRGLQVARWTGQRVWVDRRLGRHLHGPYPPELSGSANELSSLVRGLAIFIVCTIWTVGLVLAIQVPAQFAIFLFITFVLAGVLLAFLVGIRAEAITARRPAECWPELEGESGDEFVPNEPTKGN